MQPQTHDNPQTQAINQLVGLIQKQCVYTLEYFVNHVKLGQATFPLLPLTYTLWRNAAYEQISATLANHGQKDIKYAFFLASEQGYLRTFIDKVQIQMNVYCRGLEDVRENFKGIDKFDKQEQQAYDIIVQLGQKVWKQQLYLELLYDIVYVPYLKIIPKKSSLIVRAQFQTGFNQSSGPRPQIFQKFVDKVGQKFFSKALDSITTLLFSKAFVLQINTLMGTFNPVLMGASYGLSSFVKYRKQKKQQQKTIDQLKQALNHSKKKLQILQEYYERAIAQIQAILSGVLSDKQKDQSLLKLKKMFLEIFQEQWLQIQVLGDEDGWEVVHLEEKQSFQELK